jgi:hypothetical protein
MPYPLRNELPDDDAGDYWYAICPACRESGFLLKRQYAICPECRPCWLDRHWLVRLVTMYPAQSYDVVD